MKIEELKSVSQETYVALMINRQLYSGQHGKTENIEKYKIEVESLLNEKLSMLTAI